MPYDLAQMQSLPLRAKITMTQQRIRQWYEYWDGLVYVAVSGLDSTVLKHIVDSMYSDVPAVYVNTGLEYPEIQKFWKDVKAGKYDCFNSDVEFFRPEMRFDEVIKKYGYPVISKAIAQKVHDANSAKAKGNHNSYAIKQFNGEYVSKNGKTNKYSVKQWKFLLDAPFKISHKCCHEMKKKPSKKYERRTGRKAILGTLASESKDRKSTWVKFGCNAFGKGRPTSQPLSFWTKQDIYHYIKLYNVPYVSVYGDILIDEKGDVPKGQINMIDYNGVYTEEDKLKPTGCDRTGCIFCMFGCHLDEEPNRFQRLKETHPRQYDYCINGGEYNEEGMWQPSKEGLGLGKVLDYINVKY